ncbi:MAG: DivIVA domain-containing protein, partial [Actinomycetota bacterium]
MVDVDPERLEKAEFSAVRRGVDPTEVRSTLAEAADALRLLQRRCHELEHRIETLEAEIPEEGAADAEREAAREEGRRAGEAEGEQRLAAATSEAEAVVEDAKAEGRRLVQEAHTVRRRMLEDLARRRRALRQQVEQLRGGRERLLEAYEVVGHTMREATEELAAALPEARAAAERAGHRVGPEETVDQLEAEIEAARLAGLPIVDEDEPDEGPEASPPARPDTEGRRRPVAVPLERDVRDMPQVEPVVSDFEAVRLLETAPDAEQAAAEPDEPDEPDEPESGPGTADDPKATAPDTAEPAAVTDEPEPASGEPQQEVDGSTVPEAGAEPDEEPEGDLFERLREAQGDDGVAGDDEPEAPPDADDPGSTVAADDPEGSAPAQFDDPADADEPFGLVLGADVADVVEEDEARLSSELELGRRLKRILSDEQNDVLDRLRRTRKRSLDVDDLLAGLDDRV